MSLRVAVVGAGDMGRRHALHWRAAGACVAAVCDPAAARAAAAAESVGAAPHDALDTVLAGGEVDAVSVCTPTHLHASYAIQALEAGAHVLCEKPVALRMKDAERMKRAAEASGRALRIGFMRRFDAAQRELERAHAALGTPVLASATISAGMRPKRLMHDAAANGGPIIDMCCHLFDLWRTLYGGEPTEVSARGHTFAAEREELSEIPVKAVDSAAVTLAYPGGSVAQLQVSWGLPPGVAAAEQHAYLGPEGRLDVAWNERVTRTDGDGTTTWTRGNGDPWADQIAAFARELTGGAPRRLADVDDGIAALRTSLSVLACVEAAR